MTDLSSTRLSKLFSEVGFDGFPEQLSIVCAVSGGLDSMVLVHALAAAGCRLRALHVDHATHPDSEQWARQVTDKLADLSVSVTIRRIAPPTRSSNLEAYWHKARAKVFAEEVGAHEILVSAHHQDDQAETVLLQLMRGAGPTGLQAMPVLKRLDTGGWYFRPLLGFTRRQLIDYAEQRSVWWMDDPSNDNVQHDRNYLRHRVMPLLQQRWPAATKGLARSAHLMAESVELTKSLAKNEAQIDDNGLSLDWGVLEDLPEAHQANVVRYWLDQLSERYPSRERLLEALRQWRGALPDRHPQLVLENGTVHRYRKRLLYVADRPPIPSNWVGALVDGDWLALPADLGQLGWFGDRKWARMPTDRVQSFKPFRADQRLTVRFRRHGERLRRSSGQHQSLKHWFQEQGMPPSLRAYQPLIFDHEELIAVAGRWIDARYAGPVADSPTRNNYSLVWRPPATNLSK